GYYVKREINFIKIIKPDEAELVAENDETAAAAFANAPGRGLTSV
ncbi:unnamed protein product, partial [Rotaria magnacalcarata]